MKVQVCVPNNAGYAYIVEMVPSLFAPGPLSVVNRAIGAMANSLPGQFTPFALSLPGHFAPGQFIPWNFHSRAFHSLELLLPWTFVLENFCSHNVYLTFYWTKVDRRPTLCSRFLRTVTRFFLFLLPCVCSRPTCKTWVNNKRNHANRKHIWQRLTAVLRQQKYIIRI